MRQQREHNRQVIAQCAKRPPGSFWTSAGLSVGIGMVVLLMRRGGALPLVAGIAALMFFWLLACRVLPNARLAKNDPPLRTLLDRPERVVAVTHSRAWSTDTFRVFTADGATLDLASRGTLSRRLAVSLAAHCFAADVSTPWVSRSPARRAAPARAAGGFPFA